MKSLFSTIFSSQISIFSHCKHYVFFCVFCILPIFVDAQITYHQILSISVILFQVSTDSPFTRLSRSLPQSLPLSQNSYWKESAKSEKLSGKNWSGEISDIYEGREKEENGNKKRNSHSGVGDSRIRNEKRKKDGEALSNEEVHVTQNQQNKLEIKSTTVIDHFPSFVSTNDTDEYSTNTVQNKATESRRKSRALNSGIRGLRSAGSGDSVTESIGTK